jgi:RNA polymerase sigma-70 factor (ECF subfamily)
MIVGVALVLGADAPKKDDAAKDLEKFQGTWTLVSAEHNGVKASEENLKNAGVTLAVKDEKFTLKTAGGNVEGSIKLDPAKKPKAYDATGTDPTGNKQDSVGIYKLDGDTLTVCFVLAGKERPTEFKADAGSEAVLEVFKRDKK